MFPLANVKDGNKKWEKHRISERWIPERYEEDRSGNVPKMEYVIKDKPRDWMLRESKSVVGEK